MEATLKKQYHRFYASPTNWKEHLAKLFAPSWLAYLVHAERLTGLEVLHFRHIAAVDDFDAILKYKGYELEIQIDWDSDLFLSASDEMPAHLFQAVANHLDNYSMVSPWKVYALIKRYRRPAKATWIEK